MHECVRSVRVCVSEGESVWVAASVNVGMGVVWV